MSKSLPWSSFKKKINKKDATDDELFELCKSQVSMGFDLFADVI